MLTFKLYIYLLIIVISALVSCSYKNRNTILKTPYDADKINNIVVVNGQYSAKEYYNLIKPEDEIVVRNLQNRGLILPKEDVNQNTNLITTTFRVDANGEVILPLIGMIKIGGLTRKQANEKIQLAYEKTELNNPIIDIQIVNMYVNLIGEVKQPGKFIINREDYDLIDLLSEAGGVPVTANRKMIKIFRGDRNNPEIILVNLDKYDFIKDKRLKLQSKDIVYVEPRSVVTTSQDLQPYSAIASIGLLIINTFLIIYNLSK